MSHRSFDAALEASSTELDDTFDMGGRSWDLAVIPDFMLLKWVNAQAGSDGSKASLLTDLIESVVVAEQREEWQLYCREGRTADVKVEKEVTDDDEEVAEGDETPTKTVTETETVYFDFPTTAVFVELIAWAIEQQAERRPTEPSSA